MSTTRLSTKGQLVIPAGVRKRLHLRPGDSIELRVEGDRLILQAQARPTATLRRGKFRRPVLVAPRDAPPMTTESVNRLLEELP
jgi:AbrB family looped-hinge helix DNA binding protein